MNKIDSLNDQYITNKTRIDALQKILNKITEIQNNAGYSAEKMLSESINQLMSFLKIDFGKIYVRLQDIVNIGIRCIYYGLHF